MDLAMKLVSLRKKNGMTQMELAERLNISRQAISRWEAGAAFPSLDNLRLLSELYGVTINDLLNDASDYADVTADAETVSKMSDKSDEHIRFKKIRTSVICLIAFILAFLMALFVVQLCVRERKHDIPIENIATDIIKDSITNTFQLE